MNTPNIPKLLASRRDSEVLQMFTRVVIRVVAVKPELGYLLGSRADLRSIVVQLIGEELAERAEDPDLEVAVVRAVLFDAMTQPIMAGMLIDVTRMGTDTMLQTVTEQPAIAGVVMLMLDHLDIDLDDTRSELGLEIIRPDPSLIGKLLSHTLKELES